MSTYEQDLKKLKQAAVDVGKKIEDSNVFVALMSKSYKDDPMCALQLGIALLLGKPIGIIAIGTDVPPTLAKLAFHTEVVEDRKDKSAFEDATKRLLEAAKTKGVL